MVNWSSVNDALCRVTGTDASRPTSALADVVMAVGLAAGHLAVVGFAPLPPGQWAWLTFPIGGLSGAALVVRRRYPWLVFAGALGSGMLLTLLRVPEGLTGMIVLVALFSVCSQVDRGRAAVASVLAGIWPFVELGTVPADWQISSVSGSLLTMVLVAGWGQASGAASLRSARLAELVRLLEQARERLAADAATVERARIAREFHDIVSHNLSVMALRAGVARRLVDKDPEHVHETLRILEETSRFALTEMRHLLGALRGEGANDANDEVAAAEPQPGLHQIDELAASVRRAGLTVEVSYRGQPRPVSAGVEITAYRLVQEALTNVLKHAGSGRVAVLLNFAPDSLHVSITNHVDTTGLGSTGDTASSRRRLARQATSTGTDSPPGHGLIGMRERVALFGGTLTAHPIPGGFSVVATLPMPDKQSEDKQTDEAKNEQVVQQ